MSLILRQRIFKCLPISRFSDNFIFNRHNTKQIRCIVSSSVGNREIGIIGIPFSKGQVSETTLFLAGMLLLHVVKYCK